MPKVTPHATAKGRTPSLPLAGRAALVTGAGVRVGAAIARGLAAAGCDVVLHHHRSKQPAQRLAEDLRRLGVDVAVVQGDLTKAHDLANVLPQAAKALGRPLDVLVNNAASYPEETLEQLTWDSLSSSLALDAWAPLFLTRALVQQLPARGTGSVVNLLDARLVDDDRRHAGYFLAKRMLADLTRLSAMEYGPRVTVNAVAPGPTLAPADWSRAKAEAWTKRLATRLPLQAVPGPDDVAAAVATLVGSRAMTGQVLFVDGGRHLGRPEA